MRQHPCEASEWQNLRMRVSTCAPEMDEATSSPMKIMARGGAGGKEIQRKRCLHALVDVAWPKLPSSLQPRNASDT
jgi:hypothetical protein